MIILTIEKTGVWARELYNTKESRATVNFRAMIALPFMEMFVPDTGVGFKKIGTLFNLREDQDYS